MNTHTLRSLDLSKIKRLTVTRRNGAVRLMRNRDDIAHFIRNHATDLVIESQLWHGYASSKPGKDYVALVIACVEKETVSVVGGVVKGAMGFLNIRWSANR